MSCEGGGGGGGGGREGFKREGGREGGREKGKRRERGILFIDKVLYTDRYEFKVHVYFKLSDGFITGLVIYIRPQHNIHVHSLCILHY